MDLSMVENKIKEFRGQRILLDCDVASLYEVETKRINEEVSIPNTGQRHLQKKGYICWLQF